MCKIGSKVEGGLPAKDLENSRQTFPRIYLYIIGRSSANQNEHTAAWLKLLCVEEAGGQLDTQAAFMGLEW